MKKIKLLYIVFVNAFLLTQLSCTTEKANYVSYSELYAVDLDTVEILHDFKYSNIFDSVRVIRLDSEHALLGGIDKVDVYDDKLVVLDANTAQGVFIFDKNGNLIRKIGNIGFGPTEYTECTDFAIDTQHASIYVYNRFGRKINLYDLETGTYIKTLNLERGHSVDRIWCNSGILYGVSTSFDLRNTDTKHYILKQLDKDSGREVMQWMDVYQYNKGWYDEFTHTPLFYHISGGNDLFAFGLSDTIMCIGNGELTPYMAFSGNKVIKSEDILNEEINLKESDPRKRVEMRFKMLSQLGQKQGKIMNISNFFENDGILYFKYMTWPYFLTMYNLQTDAVTSYTNHKDDVLFSLHPTGYRPPSFLTSDNGGIYYLYRTDLLSELRYYFKEGLISDKVINKNVLGSINEDSNPIILYYEYGKK
ncbi:6-bladed beta-propeller [Bacteroides sp. UBA939]|uniref:6-bladed beta-propeller n=1 Tax=Bacteroides sp. UBA939 TaxID=1946092 RepID=UPI0025BBC0CF|nr:6-bladed beta-propeller [Bacteroides sp. UBA939]